MNEKVTVMVPGSPVAKATIVRIKSENIIQGPKGDKGDSGSEMTYTHTLRINSNGSQTVSAVLYGGANCAVLGSDENILTVYDGTDNSGRVLDTITSGGTRTTYGVALEVSSGSLFIECAGGTPGVFTINYNIV